MKPATSIEKVCRVLGAFRARPSLGVTELAQQTGLLPSDAHRILRSLEYLGYVTQDELTKRYRLGLELLKLGYLVHERLELCGVARPFMRHLSEIAAATANLAVFDPHELEVIFVEQADSPYKIQVPRLRVGRRAYAHATAAGKVLMAHLPEEIRQSVINKQGLPRLTPYTITDLTKFERELETVRTRGYATNHAEAIGGTFGIGVPIRDHRTEVAAALSISLMAAQIERDNELCFTEVLKSTAAKISASLGAGSDGSSGSFIHPTETEG
jgi:IclR family acetate operon transcriptional repressor